jgi:peptidoglycan pentaglycine glycine transferase (the first glycine)
MISMQPTDDREAWDEYVLENDGHPLQLWGWGQTKAEHGWRADRLFAYDMDRNIVGGAQVLIRRLPWPFKALVYVPRGPVVAPDHTTDFLIALTNYAKSQYRGVVVSIEPDWTELPQLPGGWRMSINTILISETLILDLSQSEDDLLAAMAKKTRQYIRKSGGEEAMTIRQVKSKEGIAKCLQIYDETAKRAGFALHGDQYYYDVFANLGDESPVFAAYVNDEPIAFLWLAISAKTAFELYGGMNDTGQELRANYALKWHAIRTTREWGIGRYDMNGLVSDGVSTFKRGFANHEDKLVGTYDRPLSPLYTIWTKVLPLGKRLVRTIKRK